MISIGYNTQDLAALCRIECSDSLQFPSADYRYISIDGDEDYKLEFNFMGLLGVDSALPSFFNDFLCTHPDEQQRIKDFIGLFSHHIYMLCYQVCKSQRPEILIEQGCKKWFIQLRHLMPHVPLNTGSALCSDFITNYKN